MDQFQLDGSFVGCQTSNATLRLQDMLPGALEFMADHDPEGLAVLNDEYLDDINAGLRLRYSEMVQGNKYNDGGRIIVSITCVSELGDISDDDPIWDYDNTDLDWLWSEAVYDRLNDIAPGWCYFGSQEGDGAAIGFWLSWESLHEDIMNYDPLDMLPNWHWLNVGLWRVRKLFRPGWVAWENFDSISDFLESLEHEDIPDMTVGQLSRRYAAFLVRRWLS
jgi:hypothetical protein